MMLSDKAREALQKVVEKFQSGDLSPVVHIAKIRMSDRPSAKEYIQRYAKDPLVAIAKVLDTVGKVLELLAQPA